MSYVGNTPADKFLTLEKQQFSVSATTGYTLSHSVSSPQDIALFINNVRQNPNSSYTVSNTALTLSSATSSGDTMYCVFLGKAIGTVGVPVGGVTVDKISIPDNAKLKIGTGTDLEIYHDGTNSLIDNNTGKLLLQSGSEIVVNENSVDCDFRIESNSNENLFVTNGDEGKIGMGTANPITNGAVYIDFSGGSGTGGSLLTLRAGGSTNSQNIIATTHTGVTDKSTTITTQRISDGSVDMLFATAGTGSTVGSTDMTINGDNSVISGDFNDTSDVALKENILDIPDGAITTIKALRPRTFTWITSKDEGCDKDSGFIAQEVETVLEDDVHGEDGAKGINTLGVVAHLTKALQESIAKIEALEARVTELENE